MARMTMNSDPNQAKAIFLEALEKHTPEGWSAFLDQACEGQPELRRRVEVLLKAHREAGTAPNQPPPSAATLARDPSFGPGTILGGYKLLQEIGDGGMGIVYMAEQQEPVRRKVALKIIKPGMDTRQVIARFEAERQALAMMDHQNIAKVFHAGTTETGRPYFVMELVYGVPITKFCDDNRLTLRERLDLFMPVCRAIQHAHQKGIIHRDVKPSNVLVTMYDDKPVPKVIDFGIAKATQQRLTECTLFTQFGAMVGTFEYMSPEQAEMNAFGVDTRSDVYSLGVLLYELLTGTTPLERSRLRDAALDEMIRLIKEEEPPRPSVRMSKSDTAATIAAARKTEPEQLAKFLHGDLDWIVMRCLEKQRDRRYETANGLSRDIERYLADEPVEARPPSASYRLQKFVRRHKGRVIAASLVLLALIGGIVGTSWGLFSAEQSLHAEVKQREIANKALVDGDNARKDAEKALDEAKRSNTETKAVIDFLVNDMLDAGSPDRWRGRTLTVDEVITNAEKKIDKTFAAQPLVEARIRMAIGDARYGLAQAAQAQHHFRRARDLFTEHLGPEDRQTLMAGFKLAGALGRVGKRDESRTLIEEVLAVQRRTLGADDLDTIESLTALVHA